MTNNSTNMFAQTNITNANGFTWTNRTSTHSFTWTNISITNGFTCMKRTSTNRFTWRNITITNAFTWTDGTSTNNFKNGFIKRDGIANRYSMRQCLQIFYIQIELCGAHCIFVATWNSSASDS